MRAALAIVALLLVCAAVTAWQIADRRAALTARTSTAPSLVRPITTLADLSAHLGAQRGTTVVEVGAVWCEPCQRLAPILADISAERPDVAVLTVDADQAPEVAQALGASGYPTLIKFRDGHPVARAVGFRPKALLLEWIDAAE